MENKSRFLMVKEECRLVPKWKNAVSPLSYPWYNLAASIKQDYNSHTGGRMSEKWIELPCSHLLWGIEDVFHSAKGRLQLVNIFQERNWTRANQILFLKAIMSKSANWCNKNKVILIEHYHRINVSHLKK